MRAIVRAYWPAIDEPTDIYDIPAEWTVADITRVLGDQPIAFLKIGDTVYTGYPAMLDVGLQSPLAHREAMTK